MNSVTIPPLRPTPVSHAAVTDPAPPATTALADAHYALSDNLTRSSGRVLLTGTQALVRRLCMQKRLDQAAGLAELSGFRQAHARAPDALRQSA